MAADKPNHKAQERRRSQRVFLSIPVAVEGTTPQGEKFVEETATLAVNAHGGLVTLSHAVDVKQPINLIHRSTGKQQACRVAYSGTVQRGKTEVGLEFMSPSPKFWQIDFPPTDWNPLEE
jgi:hypothetical protein